MVKINTDILNIGLMLIALVLSYYMPFRLLILAYAILGPLHYLTEINWLEKNNFFVLDRKKIIWLVGLTFLISVPYTVNQLFFGSSHSHSEAVFEKILVFIQNHNNLFILISFIVAATLVIFKENWKIISMVILGLGVGLLLMKSIWFILLVGVLLPSVIHVFIFTGLFMLYGALKNKNKLGFIAFGTLMVVPLIIYLLPLNPESYIVDVTTRNQFDSVNMTSINQVLAQVTGLIDEGSGYSILSATGLKVQVFISFAYVYHYLNWFSKTTVIGWHKVISKRKFILLISIWLISVSLYYYNYRVGFMVLIFLSFLHVILEFPLNVLSIREIGKSIFNK